MSVSVADIIKRTFKQIPQDKCVAGGGKHVNTITDPTVGYCLCPEGQTIADPLNPKCAPIDPKVPYNPFNSGFYREGTQCKQEEGLVTQKHPFHQNFGEPACISATPTCAPGFTKQQLRYDGEVLDYCIRKDADGKYVASYYPTTFLVRPPAPAPAPAPPAPPAEESPKITWLWWTIGGVVGVGILIGAIFMLLKLVGSKSESTNSLTPAAAPAPAPFQAPIVMPPTPVAPSPVVSPFRNNADVAVPTAAALAPDMKGGKGRGKGRRVAATRRK